MERADLILPSASYYETSGSYVSTEGRVQQTRGSVTPPGFSRDNWMILRALSEELGTPLPYDSLDEIRTRMAELAPHLVRYEFIENYGFDKLAHRVTETGSLVNSPLIDNVDNYYMTDAVSRNSAIMARCTKELGPKKVFNFRSSVYSL